MKQTIIGFALASILLCVAPAAAQGVSEANGTVKDREGNPIQDVEVTFRAKSNPDVPYRGTSNKKGRYYVSGLFTGKEDDLWVLELKADGWLPVEVRVESRTVNRVLIGDVMTVKLGLGKKPPEIPIRPLGSAVVDWVVAPADEIEAEAEAAAELVQAEAEAAAEEEAMKDPWVEALTLASAGSLEQSVEPFREAVEAEPDNAERHETFAKILYRLEQFDEAASEAKRAVEIEPARIESHMVLFNVYDSRGDYAAAKTSLEGAREAAPDDPRILLRLAYVANQLGDEDGAVEAYTRVTEVDPDSAEAWLALANLHSAAGRLTESEAAYAKVVEIDPEGAHQTYYNLGATIIKRSNRSESDTQRAVEAFRKALELKPDYGRAANELAIALIGLGDMAGARSTLESFVSSNPDSPESPQMKALIQSLPN